MKTIHFYTLAMALAGANVLGQGQFLFSNISAPTRIGSIDGPLAGPGYLAVMLAGTDITSLQPVGQPVEHSINGIASGGRVSVPNAPCFTSGFVQMVAWDGRLWGNSLAAVPPDQLGRTDIVPADFTCFPQPTLAPHFNMPAIIPVPEPAVSVLFALALGIGGWRVWRAKCTRNSQG